MVVIEEAHSDDIPALCGLLKVLFEQEAEFCYDEAKQTKGLEMIVSNPSIGRILVLKKEGEAIGMVSVLLSVSTALGEKVAWLEDMIVAPSYRQFGYGKMLLEAAVALAKSLTCKRITLLTDGDNTLAQRFYQSVGFQDSPMKPMRLFIL